MYSGGRYDSGTGHLGDIHYTLRSQLLVGQSVGVGGLLGVVTKVIVDIRSGDSVSVYGYCN